MLARKHQAMFHSTVYFGDGFDRVLCQRSNLQNLYRIVSRYLIANAKLPFVIHTPCVHISSLGKSYRELFAHTKVSNHRISCCFAFDILT